MPNTHGESHLFFWSVLPDREQVGHCPPSHTLYYLWLPTGRAARAACVPVTEPEHRRNLPIHAPPSRLLSTTAIPKPGLT